MWTNTYTYLGRERTVEIPFQPYVNRLSYLNDSHEENKKWELEGLKPLQLDLNHPIVSNSGIVINTMAEHFGDMESSMKRTEILEPNTTYMVSVYVRNNGFTSTRLFLNGEYKDSVNEKFSERVTGVVTTDDTGELEIKLTYNDRYALIGLWIDGFFATELPEANRNKSIRELNEIYPFVKDRKDTPTGYDILDKALHGSPHAYTIAHQGVTMPFILEELGSRNIQSGDHLEFAENTHEKAIFGAFSTDTVMKSMLEGGRNRITHAFPKQDSKMATMDEAHFPRVQFFTGGGVGKLMADGRPFAEMINYTMNYYIPITKVIPSVTAIMIAEQASAIMADLGWSKVRGSDYFMQLEQMYVLQSQFIKDTTVKRRRK